MPNMETLEREFMLLYQVVMWLLFHVAVLLRCTMSEAEILTQVYGILFLRMIFRLVQDAAP